MSVLDRAALEESPLADLHAIASELSIDGYRRLRRPDLIDAILSRQGDDDGQDEPASASEPDVYEEPEALEPDDDFAVPHTEPEEAVAEFYEDVAEPTIYGDDQEAEGLTELVAEQLRAHDEERTPARRRRGRRGGRGRSGTARETAPPAEEAEPEEPEQEEPAEAEAEEPARGEAEEPARGEAEEPARGEAEEPARGEEIVSGIVELLPNGSGFLRVEPPDPSDDDVYISAAQVKRCELVTGDEISGPRRAPRRSERFASMIRIDTINDLPASEVADTVRFDDLPAAFPDDRFRLGSEDPTIKAIEWLTPFGRGSRVTITGPPRSGKSQAAARLTATLADLDGLQLSVVLVGVRPEEISEYNRGPHEPAAGVNFGASADAQGQVVERVIEQARRHAARGADTVVVIDTLDGLHHHVARKIMASARNIVDGGSLTVIATATQPIGGETTVIALDGTLASTHRYPALDLVASGTIKPELLVGEAGAEAIAGARVEALEARTRP